MLSSRLIINNQGPTETVFNAVIAGTALEFPLYFEDETSPGSGVYVPLDLTDGTFLSQIRYSPFDATAIATLTVTPRTGLELGWVDFFLEASKTLAVGNADVHWACHFMPAAPNAEHARQIAVGVIPIRWGAVRP